MKRITSVLIANRGEIAIRIARTLKRLGVSCVTICSADDREALHCPSGDRTVALEGVGAAAYLNAEQIVNAALEVGCDAIHPGYGFLSESADFAAACEEAGLVFIGPLPETLRLFGDKAEARRAAQKIGVPVLPGIDRPVTLPEIREFFTANGGRTVVIKAVAGGGGRGMRIVGTASELDRAYELCVREAERAFGKGDVLVEAFLSGARHVEVQVVGDGTAVSHLWERDCTLQRRGQKLVEFAPAPFLDEELRRRILNAATQLAQSAGYRGIGTVEFLVSGKAEPEFWFMEANPRLQVEHTVTEQITGLDLVEIQLRLAEGSVLSDLAIDKAVAQPPSAMAVQLRVNLENMDDDGRAVPSEGTLAEYSPPAGAGIRVDGHGFTGYRTNANFDSLLAKLVVGPVEGGLSALLSAARRAVGDFAVEGAGTNLPLLRALLDLPELETYRVHTRFLEERLAELNRGISGAWDGKHSESVAELIGEDMVVRATMAGQVVEVGVSPGAVVGRQSELLVLEAMKMQHSITAGASGVIERVFVNSGDSVSQGEVLVTLQRHADQSLDVPDPTRVEEEFGMTRPELQALFDRLGTTRDENRPEAVARRRSRGQRTARENVADLCDPGSFEEYGALAVAGQRLRRSEEELIRISPADGLITGVGTVNAALFGDESTRTAVMAYDATVFAGTQGSVNHLKTDRLIDLAEEFRLPFVLYGEGGGGRPGETDYPHVGGLYTPSFQKLGRLSGHVPTIAMVSGRCFAGNAALVGGCDIVVAARGANIGMGGPVMIEGGGLGVVKPEEVGPVEAQEANGLIHVTVSDEAEGTAVVRALLAYFQGRTNDWQAADQTALRNLIPADRRRSYSVRSIVGMLADTGSFLELRPAFGPSVVTGFMRVEGRPIGVMASDPQHLGGAIDVEAADKMTGFIELCDAHSLPILSLVDTPGFMVGTEIEKRGMVRSSGALFRAGAKASVPIFCLVLKRCFGLGSMAYMGGHTRAPASCVSWPQGEFGGMGLEGHIKLAYRRELDAIPDAGARAAEFDRLLGELRSRGGAVSTASYLEIDGVIDPADTRIWLLRGLKAANARSGKL